jgi:hypothetical protein
MCLEEIRNYRTYLRSSRSHKQAVSCCPLNILWYLPPGGRAVHYTLAACFCSLLRRPGIVEINGANNGRHMVDGRG